MKKIKISVSFILFFCLVFSIVNLKAQVFTNNVTPGVIEKRPNYIMAVQAELVIMPGVNVDMLIEEDIIRDKMSAPYRFGKKIHTDLTLENSGTWYDLDDGSRLWALRISSKGAISINLIFDKFYLSEGAKFYIFNENKTVISGPYTSELNNPQSMLGTDLIKGDEIIIEYTEPKEAAGHSKFHIKTVVHGYREVLNTKSGNFIDVNCPEGNGWQKESDAIVHIVAEDQKCSGTLINNTENDRTPSYINRQPLFNT